MFRNTNTCFVRKKNTTFLQSTSVSFRIALVSMGKETSEKMYSSGVHVSSKRVLCGFANFTQLEVQCL
jgi:hypothetical protein